MAAPTQSEAASLVATLAAGIMAGHESWRAFEHEALEGETFEQWAVRKAKVLAKQVWRDAK